jgi:GrpB-like predicted nucleotidyltransferase (UPF0157 family)
MPDQPVEIVEYDPAWSARFADQQSQVSAVLSAWLAGPVEHIGSTSVPGLPAKPVVDMLALVRSLDEVQAAVGILGANGWVFWPDDPCRDCRLWFLRPRPEARTHHLHVIERDHPHARALLSFRDALRIDQDLRREYARLKKDLADQHRDNRNAYSNAKGEFVERVLRGVGVEPPLRERLPE